MKIETVKIETIKPYENNPRKNEKAVPKVKLSLEEFGWQQPIVVDSNNTIIVGHTRYLAALELGYTEVPVQKASKLTPEQCDAYRIMDNLSNEEAKWDNKLLAEEIANLEDKIDLKLTGLTNKQIEQLFFQDDPHSDPDDVPEVDVAVTKEGYLYECGSHRVMCGSATIKEDVLVLTTGQKMDMWWTDPPYGVDYVKKLDGYGGNALSKTRKQTHIKNDDLKEDNLQSFLTTAFQNVYDVAKDGCTYYMTYADMQTIAFRQALIASKWTLRQCLIWVKNRPTFSRQDFNWMQEPVLYGWKTTGRYFCGDHTLRTVMEQSNDLSALKKDELIAIIESIPTDTIEVDRPNKSDLHPTMKPVELIKRNIMASSQIKDKVIDTFGGSGSTLIACQATGRHGYVMELSPHYVDIIVQRWQDYTQQEAMCINTGETYNTMRDNAS